MTRTDNLPMFAPADWMVALDLLEPVAPVSPGCWPGTPERLRGLEMYRRWQRCEDRRVEMTSRAGRVPGNNER